MELGYVQGFLSERKETKIISRKPLFTFKLKNCIKPNRKCRNQCFFVFRSHKTQKVMSTFFIRCFVCRVPRVHPCCCQTKSPPHLITHVHSALILTNSPIVTYPPFNCKILLVQSDGWFHAPCSLNNHATCPWLLYNMRGENNYGRSIGHRESVATLLQLPLLMVQDSLLSRCKSGSPCFLKLN